MPTLPTWSIEDETDEALAALHVRGLTWLQQRAIAACALNLSDEQLADHLAISSNTARGQRSRAEEKVFALTDLPRGRMHLGRWCGFHVECCVAEAARRVADGTWLVA